MKKYFLILISLLFCLHLPGLSSAQPQLSGALSGTLGPGAFTIVGDIRVEAEDSLMILPGTSLLHTGAFKWDIYGLLKAEGTETDSIYFVRFDTIPEHCWYGIRFQEGASDSSNIDYCVIDNCEDNWSPYLPGGGIYTNGVDITVKNTRISNCGVHGYGCGGGIRAYNACITVENCLIVDNTDHSNNSSGGGILLAGCPNANIMYNEIARNIAWDD